MDLLQNFRNKQIIRTQIHCPQPLAIILDYCQYCINSEFDHNSKQIYRNKNKKHLVNSCLITAFQSLNRQQKVRFYIRIITHAENIYKGIDIQPQVSEVKMKPIQGMCECKSFNFKIWKLKNIRLDRGRHQVMVQNEKDGKIKTYQLKNYLIRRSKTKSKFALVLQAINAIPPQKSRQVHIAFQDQPMLRLWYNLIRQQVEVCEWLNVKTMYSKLTNSSISSKSESSHNSKLVSKNLLNSSITSISNISKKQLQMIKDNDLSVDSIVNQKKKLNQKQEEILGRRKTFIDHLVDDDCVDLEEFFDIIEEETQGDVEKKKNLDFFHKIMPDYNLQDLVGGCYGYQVMLEEYGGDFKVLRNIDNQEKFKLLVNFDENSFTTKQIFCLISQPRYTLTINDNIEEQTVKTLLKSENSAIMYQTLKAYNKFYRMRDFVFVRHAFSHNGNFYLVDKSIDNISFPPFMTLVRGEISALWGIFKDQGKKQITLSGEFCIVNSGLLNSQQEKNLSLKYLTGFKELLKVKPEPTMESSMFDIEWDIDKKEENKQLQEIRFQRKTVHAQMLKLMTSKSQQQNELNFHKKTSISYEVPSLSTQKNHVEERKNEIMISNKDHVNHQTHEIKEIQEKEITTPPKVENQISPIKPMQQKIMPHSVLEVIRKIDSQGYVIIDKNYISKRYLTSPRQKIPYQENKIIKGHAIWKGQWIHDNKLGGMIYINQKKIQDQKGVLKFILTKIGKNILSGKSILNISLPVDIFSAESNLQRLLIGMVYGPKLLQGLNQKPLLQKLAKVVSFGLSNSVMYISIQKPFNPILGETFQCWINGCPAYGQQISHHPPIASLLLVGRGYRVTCQLESKVQLHMNSGCGTNDGVYKVTFDDGDEICFMTPGGEISGLTFGERKLNLVGKSYYWCQKANIVLELNFQAGKKSFFSKQQKTCDYFEGKVFEVTADFFKTFPKTKKREPSDKQKVRELGTFEGIWSNYVKFNGKEIFNFDQVLPLRLEYESQPLASDSNWREDIEYRRLNKITRAQTEKQRLQVVQRTDRKFRQKYQKKK